MKITQKIEFTTIKLTEATNQRQKLENRVRLLRSGSLDPDLLEERARAVLNYADQNDQIVFEFVLVLDFAQMCYEKSRFLMQIECLGVYAVG